MTRRSKNLVDSNQHRSSVCVCSVLRTARLSLCIFAWLFMKAGVQLCFNNFILARIQTTWNRDEPLFTPIKTLLSFREKSTRRRNENRRGQICLSVRRAIANAQNEKRRRLPRDNYQQSRKRRQKSTSTMLLAWPPVCPYASHPFLFGYYILPRCYRSKLCSLFVILGFNWLSN